MRYYQQVQALDVEGRGRKVAVPYGLSSGRIRLRSWAATESDRAAAVVESARPALGTYVISPPAWDLHFEVYPRSAPGHSP
jgi:hypothetical protein